MKTDEYVKTFGPEISSMDYRKSSVLDMVRSSISMISVRTSHRTSSRNRDGATSTNGMWHSANADTSFLVGENKNSDIRVLQFMVDLNPLNKHVRDNLGDAGIRAVEEECWARCRQLAEAQHIVSKLLELLLPSESGNVTRRIRVRTPSGRRRVRRSWLEKKFPLSTEVEALDVAPAAASKPVVGLISRVQRNSRTWRCSRGEKWCATATIIRSCVSRPEACGSIDENGASSCSHANDEVPLAARDRDRILWRTWS